MHAWRGTVFVTTYIIMWFSFRKMNQEQPILFECAKLFEVKDSTPGAGGENPSHTLGEWLLLFLFHVDLLFVPVYLKYKNLSKYVHECFLTFPGLCFLCLLCSPCSPCVLPDPSAPNVPSSPSSVSFFSVGSISSVYGNALAVWMLINTPWNMALSLVPTCTRLQALAWLTELLQDGLEVEQTVWPTCCTITSGKLGIWTTGGQPVSASGM